MPCAKGTFSKAGSRLCTVCPIGTYQDDMRSEMCKTCPSGTANGVAAAVSLFVCKPCEAGTIIRRGASACRNCGLGLYQDRAGSATCKKCPGGTFSNNVGVAEVIGCKPCAAGTFSKEGARACEVSGVGRYQDRKGMETFKKCPSGTFTNLLGLSAMDQCIDCPKVTFSGTGARLCRSCPVGTYQHRTGSTRCIACPSGTFSSRAGIISRGAFKPCAKGTRSYSGSSTCSPCGSGTYGDRVGLALFKYCPSGTFNEVKGAKKRGASKPCPKGSYSSEGSPACRLCNSGSYQNVVVSGTCKMCPRCTFSTKRGAVSKVVYTKCKPGQFQQYQGQLYCSQCGQGRYANVAGAQICSKCPSGTFSTAYGAKKATTCKRLPPGTSSSASAYRCRIK